jgi:hypothetical protein
LTDLDDLVLGAGEADLQPFDFAQPSFTSGFGYAGFEVVADLDQPVVLARLGPE